MDLAKSTVTDSHDRTHRVLTPSGTRPSKPTDQFTIFLLVICVPFWKLIGIF